VGLELLELVELRVGGVDERVVGVDGGVLAAGGLGVALGRGVVVVLSHLRHPHRLVHGGQVRVAPARPRHRSISPLHCTLAGRLQALLRLLLLVLVFVSSGID
jgi:hypothetical protein